MHDIEAAAKRYPRGITPQTESHFQAEIGGIRKLSKGPRIMIEHWYITVAACLDWQKICGINPPRDEGDVFDHAAKELDYFCRSLDRDRHYKSTGREGTEIWVAKTTVRNRRVRIEIYVRHQSRPEGDAPQVVRVRRK